MIFQGRVAAGTGRKVGSGECAAVAAREERPPATQSDVLARHGERGVILEKTGMPTFIARHLGFQCGRCFQTGREHGAIGEFDTDFRAVDGVLVDGEAANGPSDEFLTNDYAKSSLCTAMVDGRVRCCSGTASLWRFDCIAPKQLEPLPAARILVVSKFSTIIWKGAVWGWMPVRAQGIVLNSLCCPERQDFSLCMGDGNRISSNDLGKTFAVRPRKQP